MVCLYYVVFIDNIFYKHVVFLFVFFVASASFNVKCLVNCISENSFFDYKVKVSIIILPFIQLHLTLWHCWDLPP